MSEVSKGLFLESKFLGTKIGKHIKFLAETSCMNPEQRRSIANAHILLLYFEFKKKHADATFEDFIENFIVPALELIGFAEWQRDVLTDLSLRSATITRQWDIDLSARGDGESES